MPPTHEGTELFDAIDPGPNGSSAVYFKSWERDLICGLRSRPVVLTKTPAEYLHHFAGITGPFASLVATTDINFPAGNITDAAVKVFIARYSSTRLIASAPAVAFAGVISNPCPLYPAGDANYQALAAQAISLNWSAFTKMGGDTATDDYDKYIVGASFSSALGESYILGSVPADGEFTITNVALTTNVATITLSDVTGLSTGSVVTVNASDNEFDGTGITLTGVNATTNTITFALTHANIPSAAATGTVTITAGSSFLYNPPTTEEPIPDATFPSPDITAEY